MFFRFKVFWPVWLLPACFRRVRLSHCYALDLGIASNLWTFFSWLRDLPSGPSTSLFVLIWLLAYWAYLSQLLLAIAPAESTAFYRSLARPYPWIAPCQNQAAETVTHLFEAKDCPSTLTYLPHVLSKSCEATVFPLPQIWTSYAADPTRWLPVLS